MKVDATTTYQQQNYQQNFTAKTKLIKKIRKGSQVYNLRVFNNMPGTDQVLQKGIVRVEYLTQPRSIFGIQLPERVLTATTFINIREWAETVSGRKVSEFVTKNMKQAKSKKKPGKSSVEENTIRKVVQHLKSKTISDIGNDGMIQ